MLKAFLFLKYLSFCPDVLVMKENGFVRNLRLNSKSLTSQTRQQLITMHILPNISKKKDYQTITFGQLIEYNVRNIFFFKN